ncbi:MAG: hypothetical protein Q8L98_02895 [Chlamydiales bacterium]|nr:hypothetical protein [Chlamydiales bacterium]
MLAGNMSPVSPSSLKTPQSLALSNTPSHSDWAKVSQTAKEAMAITGLVIAGCVAGSFAFPPATPIFVGLGLGTLVVFSTACVTASIFHRQKADSTPARGEMDPPIPEKNGKSVEALEEAPKSSHIINEEISEELDDIGDDWESPQIGELSPKEKAEREQRVALSKVRWQGSAQLDVNDIHHFMMKKKKELPGIKYSFAGDEIDLGNDPAKKEEPIELEIELVGMRGVETWWEFLAFLLSRLMGEKPRYFEPHFAVFIVDHKTKTIEYFDPKNTALHDALIQRNNKGEEVRVEAIKNGLVNQYNGYTFSQYGFHVDGTSNKEQVQVQSLLDTKSCGPQCVRRIQQYIHRATNKDVIREVVGISPPPLSTSFGDLQISGEKFFEETKDLIL